MPTAKPKNEVDGAKVVTCSEANQLLNTDQAFKAWFRPDGIVNYSNPDSDRAFVWLKED